MSGKRVIRNVAWNGAGLAATTAVGFVLAPFLVHHLGDTRYGLWIVIGSLTGYCGLLELGVRGSVGRHIAYHRARADLRGVNETFNTGIVLLLGLGVLGLGVILGFLPFFFELFQAPDVTPGEAAGVRLALALVGVNLALSLVMDVFDSALWGLQRFDLLNAVEIPSALLRAVLTFWLVGRGGGLVTLAVINLGVSTLDGLVKGACCLAEEPGLRLGWGLVRPHACREILGYSVWTIIGGITRLTRTSLSPLLIGNLLGVALITPFAVAGKLIAYTATVLVAATDFVTPWATDLYAQDRQAAQRRLFLLGGRYCCALSLFLLTLLVLLGRPLIVLWMGPALAYAAPLLTVLALGEVLPGSQYVTYGMTMAAARHRALAFLYVTETVANVVLTVLLARQFGLMGACVAAAIPASLCRGVAFVAHGCRMTGVPVLHYLRGALLPALGCALPPAALLGGLVAWEEPRGWGRLVLYGLAYGACFALCGSSLAGHRPVWGWLARIGGLVSRLLASPARGRPERDFEDGPALEPGVTYES